jgi:3-mercaptopyruvate sulfurtransferase SseA
MLKADAKREGTAHMTTYARPESLAETAWLTERIGDPGLRVIEVDKETTAHHKGHIRGAIGWSWPADLHATVGRDYLDQATLSRLLAAAGLARTQLVRPHRAPRLSRRKNYDGSWTDYGSLIGVPFEIG